MTVESTKRMLAPRMFASRMFAPAMLRGRGPASLPAGELSFAADVEQSVESRCEVSPTTRAQVSTVATVREAPHV